MNWGRFLLVVILSGVVASITDWLFMGMLFHQRYLETPEIWRPGQSEAMKIAWSEAVGLIACAAFAGLLVLTGRQGLGAAMPLVALVWLAGPVSLLAMNVLWMKFDPLIAASHGVGWLVRLVITAGFAAWLL